MRFAAGALFVGALTACGTIAGVDWDRAHDSVGRDGNPGGATRGPGGMDPGSPGGLPGTTMGPAPSGPGADPCGPGEVACVPGSCCAANDDPGQPLHIAAGGQTSCVVTTTGQVRCWGDNDAGQLGRGDDAVPLTMSTTPLGVALIPAGAESITVGASHACAVVSGALVCWGSNEHGELGIGSNQSVPSPKVVSAFTNLGPHAIVAAAGASYTCATGGGKTACWGLNANYQIGDEFDRMLSTPRELKALAGATAIAAGVSHTCAVTSAGVSCWGNNSSDALGTAGATLTGTPLPVSNTAGASAVFVNGGHSCAIVQANGQGSARCWGDDVFGELGVDADLPALVTADPVVPHGLLQGVTSMCTGVNHTCAVVAGAVKCFGANESGELGTGDMTPRTVPTDLKSAPGTALEVACGLNHTCAIFEVSGSPKVFCWGLNQRGQIGAGSAMPMHEAPTPVTWP
jgi:alpha-tubulin suppressor-like RCC1 family protein